MKKYNYITLLLLMATMLFGCKSNNIDDKEELDKQHMLKLIEDIIDNPTNIIETLENSQYIKCDYYISRIERDERELTGFTNVVNYLIENNYTYEAIDVYDYNETKDVDGFHPTRKKSFHLYYVVNKGKENQDYITFHFYSKNESIIFDGLYQPID